MKQKKKKEKSIEEKSCLELEIRDERFLLSEERYHDSKRESFNVLSLCRNFNSAATRDPFIVILRGQDRGIGG